MDQARYYVCESCMTPVPSGHKFCGRCGAPVPDAMLHQPVEFYSDMQDPSKARLILIRGEGMDGLSYHLKADQHIVGRAGQVEFPDDPFVSPKHANFFYRDDRLVVRDEGSLNGVYFRIRGTVEIAPGDTFLAGEQLFRLDPTPKASDGADPDGTYFYSSPKYPSAFRLNQMLEGGAVGMTVCTRGTSIQIGREDGDLNFPADLFMSARHCTVEEREGKYYLTDLDSRNGTYVRIKTERAAEPRRLRLHRPAPAARRDELELERPRQSCASGTQRATATAPTVRLERVGRRDGRLGRVNELSPVGRGVERRNFVRDGIEARAREAAGASGFDARQDGGHATNGLGDTARDVQAIDDRFEEAVGGLDAIARAHARLTQRLDEQHGDEHDLVERLAALLGSAIDLVEQTPEGVVVLR